MKKCQSTEFDKLVNRKSISNIIKKDYFLLFCYIFYIHYVEFNLFCLTWLILLLSCLFSFLLLQSWCIQRLFKVISHVLYYCLYLEIFIRPCTLWMNNLKKDDIHVNHLLSTVLSTVHRTFIFAVLLKLAGCFCPAGSLLKGYWHQKSRT